MEVLRRAPDAHTAPEGSSGSGWGHRPALDGLRVLAVYLVVAFHGGLGTFSGGFIGVDLFFVLSGFLVTNVLLEEQDTRGRIRPARFYARRVRRLLPASLLAIVGTAAAFVLVAPPAERRVALGGARAAAMYVANWHFLGQANDYFASEDAPSPFLHYWSLGIEEQFYLVFPILLVGLIVASRRVGDRRVLVAGLGLACAASVAAQWSIASTDALQAYYGTHTRLYQLLAGAALAAGLRYLPSVRRWWPAPGLGAWVGAVALVVVASSAVTPSPSARGIAAAAVSVYLIGSLEVDRAGSAARALDRPSLGYLGRISYGTYLWHWPVIVIVGRVVELSPVAATATSAVAGTALAALSFEIVETPIRRTPRLARFSRQVVVVGLAASVIVGVLVAPAILRSDRPMAATQAEGVTVASDIDGPVPEDVPWEAAQTDTPVEPVCLDRPAEDCIIVRGDGPRVHLVGDSHAKTIIPLFEELARERGWTFSATITGACPWQRGLLYNDNEERTERCNAYQPDWYGRVIPELDPDVVVLFHRAYDDPKFPRRMIPMDPELEDLEQADLVRTLSERTIDELVDSGRRVVILEPLPIARHNPTACLSGAKLLSDCAFNATATELPSEAVYRYADLRSPKVWSIDFDRLTCPDFPVCLPMIDGLVVRRDRHHLTGTFARHIAPEVGVLLDDAGVFDGL